MLLPNVLAAQRAREAGAIDAILVRDGLALEGTKANLFLVAGGVLRTAPNGPRILPGVTRGAAIAAARALGIEVEERAFTVDEMFRADEVFFASTTLWTYPLVEIDGRTIGGGRPGPIAPRLAARRSTPTSRADSAPRRPTRSRRATRTCRTTVIRFGRHAGDAVLEDPVDGVLVEDPDVAVRDDVELQRLELQAEPVGHVADRQVPEIRQPRLRADRVVLRDLDGDLVVGILVRPGLDRRKRGVDARRARARRCIRSWDADGIASSGARRRRRRWGCRVSEATHRDLIESRAGVTCARHGNL